MNMFQILSGTFQITAKIREIIYQIMGKNDRKMVVPMNTLKKTRGRVVPRRGDFILLYSFPFYVNHIYC